MSPDDPEADYVLSRDATAAATAAGREREVDALWVVEHVARELDVACAVRHVAAARHGLAIEIVSTLSDPQRIARRISPRVVVMPIFYGASEVPERHFVSQWPEATFLSLSWEQVFSVASRSYKRLRDDFARLSVLHQTWGESFRRQFLEQGVPAEHLFVNGHLAYKLFDPPYRDYFPSRAELARRHGLDPHRRWVLFTDNYGWAFRRDRDFEKLDELDGSRDTIARLRRFHERSFGLVAGWCRSVAALGEVELVLRPRPATAVPVMTERIRRAAGPLPEHLRVIKDGSVREWILAADVVISSYSTTLIEAAIAGRPAYMVEPEAPPPELECDWYRHATRIGDRDAFLSVCRGRTSTDVSRQLSHWGRAEFLGCGDPIDRLADHLGRIARSEYERPPLPAAAELPPPRHGLFGLARACYELWQRARRRVLIALRPSSAHDAQEMDRFGPGEVERRTRAWAHRLGSGDSPGGEA